VRVENVDVARDVCDEIADWSKQHRARDIDPGRAGELGAGRGEQADTVAQRREPLHQRRHDALRPAIAPHRQWMMGQDRDVQS
jgi:hypothetical protein